MGARPLPLLRRSVGPAGRELGAGKAPTHGFFSSFRVNGRGWDAPACVLQLPRASGLLIQRIPKAASWRAHVARVQEPYPPHCWSPSRTEPLRGMDGERMKNLSFLVKDYFQSQLSADNADGHGADLGGDVVRFAETIVRPRGGTASVAALGKQTG